MGVVGFPSILLIQFVKVVVFPSNFWFRNFKVVVFPSNFWKNTIIWQFFKVILNFAQECYYLKNKVGVVDFTKARKVVKFQSPRAQSGPWTLKHYHSLGICKIYYSHFIFEVMYHYWQIRPGLPKQLKTHIAFWMFPILDTNLC